MPWGRVDDHHYRHPKVTELDESLRKGCLALFWLAISWCNDHLTDGRVPHGAVRLLGGDVAEADELVRVGMWEYATGGYQVHDFLDFNKSKAQVDAEKVQRRLAGSAGARARWHLANDAANDPANEVLSEVPSELHGGKDAPVTRNPSPVTPYPDTQIARADFPSIDHDAQMFLEGLTGRLITVAGYKQLVEYDRQIQDHGLVAVLDAYRRVANTLKPNPTARQVVWSARAILEPFADPKAIKAKETSEVDEDRARRREEAVWTRRIDNYRAGGKWDPAWGDPPGAAA